MSILHQHTNFKPIVPLSGTVDDGLLHCVQNQQSLFKFINIVHSRIVSCDASKCRELCHSLEPMMCYNRCCVICTCRQSAANAATTTTDTDVTSKLWWAKTKKNQTSSTSASRRPDPIHRLLQQWMFVYVIIAVHSLSVCVMTAVYSRATVTNLPYSVPLVEKLAKMQEIDNVDSSWWNKRTR